MQLIGLFVEYILKLRFLVVVYSIKKLIIIYMKVEMRAKILFAAVLFICFLHQSYAQPITKGTIKGNVIDSKDNKPMENANVGLFNYTDSTFIGGSVTNRAGNFLIENVLVGKYYLQVTFVGYEKAIISDAAITNENKDVSVGTISLKSTSVELGEVKAVGEKPIEEFHIDKKVINVSKSLSATSGTALDVLKEQPSVQQDQEGNITLRGSSNFTVQVNGRPSVLQGSDALRQIPANIIDNIELITNPSAKYDAEGSAGIINIITKKQTESNLSGIFNVGSGSRDKYNTESTINYKNSDYTLTGGFDYRKGTNLIDQKIERETYLPTETILNNTSVDGLVIRNNYAIRAGLDYNFSQQSGIALNAAAGKVDLKRSFDFSTHNLSTAADDYIFVDDNYDLTANYVNSSLYYNNKFTPGVDELVFEATYTNLFMPRTQNTSEYKSDASFKNLLPNPKMREFKDDTKRNDGRIKLNYTYTFNPKSKLETGLQSTLSFKKFDISNKVFNWTTLVWDVKTDFTNQFDFRNNVYAAFVTYSDNLFDFDYQLGLRTEYTDRVLEQITMSKDYKFTKLDFFPSLNLLRKIGEGNQIQFSYTRRINRPVEQLLNPYPNYSDSYISSVGNPDLLPEYTHSFELNFQKFIPGVFLSAQTYMRLQDDSFTQTMTVDDKGKLVISFDNIAKTRTIGAELSSSITMIPWLRIDPAVNLFHNNISGEILKKNVDNSTFSWTARLITTFILGADTRIQLMSNYIGKQITAQGEIKPFLMLSANIRREFFDKKLSVTLQAQNLFKTLKFDVDFKSDNFKTFALVTPESPVFYLTLSYSINNFKRSTRAPEKVDLNVNEGL